MTAVKPTPARIALMRAVDNPDVEVYASARLGGSWSTAEVWLKEPYTMARKVTKQVGTLEAAGLVVRARPGVRYHQPRPYSLTDAGRVWLAQHAEEHEST